MEGFATVDDLVDADEGSSVTAMTRRCPRAVAIMTPTSSAPVISVGVVSEAVGQLDECLGQLLFAVHHPSPFPVIAAGALIVLGPPCAQ